VELCTALAALDLKIVWQSVRKEDRLEAYATLLFGASSDNSGSGGKTIAADPPQRGDGVK
jgi:hypothetical protein